MFSLFPTEKAVLVRRAARTLPGRSETVPASSTCYGPFSAEAAHRFLDALVADIDAGREAESTRASIVDFQDAA